MSLTSVFTAIANAIRTKGGTSATMTPAEMPQAIADLPSGGSIDWAFGHGTEWPSVIDLGDYYTGTGSSVSSNLKIAAGRLYGLGLVIPASSTYIDPVNYDPPIDEIIMPPAANFDPTTSAGNIAFKKCAAKKLSFPAEMTRFGHVAGSGGSYVYSPFYCCMFKGIDIPATVEYIGRYAFYMLTAAYTKWIKIKATNVRANAFYNCRNNWMGYWDNWDSNGTQGATQSPTKVWISNDVYTIDGSSTSDGAFHGGQADALEFYCEPASKPSNWGSYWNYYDSSGQYTIHWGVTEEEFNEIAGITE